MYKKLCFALFCVFLSLSLCPCLLATDLESEDISAKGAVLIETESNTVVFEKNKDLVLPMASTTKIMTAIVAIENCSLDDIVTIPFEATNIEGSSIYLQQGERLSVRELLYALLLESANDSAVALAYATCGSLEDFVDLMNEKATQLGLESTHFTNPHGLDDEEHHTTAYELGLLSCYAMKNPIFREIVSTYKTTIPLNNGEGTRVLVNHNKLLRSFEGANGIKTGFTKKCGRCLVSSAEVDGVNMICVTLNAPNDWQDHKNMLEYGFSKYECIDLADSGDYVLELDVINGQKSTALVTNHDKLSVVLPKDSIDISARLEINRLLCAPVNQGDYVGRVVFYNSDKEIGILPLYALENVKDIRYKKSIFERIFG
ncbi:MAG: D-alanyl-D-alanine carboxypeptidase [Clostridia bacterium]|nr:D-alanyl-D-alanine carboxypeptidase [Clostridia bacterium]